MDWSVHNKGVLRVIQTQLRKEEKEEYFQLVVESMIPNMFHILPVLDNTIVDRIVYIQLMPEHSASLPNNYILNETKCYFK